MKRKDTTGISFRLAVTQLRELKRIAREQAARTGEDCRYTDLIRSLITDYLKGFRA